MDRALIIGIIKLLLIKALASNTELLHLHVFIIKCVCPIHGLSQYLETGCPNRGFIDFCVSKVWYKVNSTNEINPIYLQILLFRPVTALCVL